MKNSYLSVTDQFCGAGGSSQGVRRLAQKHPGVEVKLAMAFDRDYIILGNQKDQVKQCGNAVTPPAMEWLVEQSVNSLS